MRRDHMVCIVATRGAVTGHPSDGAKTKFPKVPRGACILVLGFRGSFVFRLPLYNPSGERMAFISGNPSSFSLLYFPSYFP
jgi:hypothetical protein